MRRRWLTNAWMKRRAAACRAKWRPFLQLWFVLFVLALTGRSLAQAPIKIFHHEFTLPPGFTIEAAASPPLVERPITIDFDEQGRLYVAESSGSNEKVQVQLLKKPHRILRLEDKNGDGVFDHKTVFADGMMFPEGTLWYRGSLYVAAPPSIWKLTDTDGDGVADQRLEWYKGKTLTGCANDLHGPYLGPDGWIYWGKGAFAPQTIERPGRKPLITRAAHIFRCRPDGSGIESVITGGMDNPVDVAFTPGGEPIFTTTFLQYPAAGKRDGLLHAVHGGIYGKEFMDVIAEHPWTRPRVMPVLSHLGPAAPAGLHRYEALAFGDGYRDNLFACLFNLRKVTRHVLTPDGATFRSKDLDFVVSSHKEFHPTDVIEDADGSLLIVDTGGWYKLCCPTSQLVRPDVLGGIFRVRRSAGPNDPRGLKIQWTEITDVELARLLGDDRAAVRRRAKELLVDRSEGNGKAIAELKQLLTESRSSQVRREVVWTLVQMEVDAARPLLRRALNDGDETVRQAALTGLNRRPDAKAEGELLHLVQNGTPANQRAAAEALGRLHSTAAVPALLDALSRSVDDILVHSFTYALLEVGDAKATSAGLTHASPRVRQAVLMALEQMEGSSLNAGSVMAHLLDADRDLRAVAWWIAGRHPQWGDDLARFLGATLRTGRIQPGDHDELANQLARLGRSQAIQQMLADLANGPDAASQRLALVSMSRTNLKETPPSWLEAIASALKDGDASIVGEAAKAARALRLPRQLPASLRDALAHVAADFKLPPLLRLHALSAGSTGEVIAPAAFALVKKSVESSRPVAIRILAAEVLGRGAVSREQLLELAAMLPRVGPLELDRLLDAFATSGDDTVGQRLLDSLEQPALRSAVRVDLIARVTKKFGPAVRKRGEELGARLDANVGKQRDHLESLMGNLPPGDLHRGQALFNQSKTACVACHTIGYVGGKTGPDLTRIGSIRSKGDLLEAIVFPSASFVRGFEPVVITTAEGRTHNGLVKTENVDDITLTTGPEQEIRLSRRNIEGIQPSRVSVMPAGLEQQLTAQELADLVAFLQACR